MCCFRGFAAGPESVLRGSRHSGLICHSDFELRLCRLLAIAGSRARIEAEAGRTVAPCGEESPSTQGEALVKSEAAGRRRPVDGKCHRNHTAACAHAARVKKCGKSALSRAVTHGMEKPCPVQDQYENRTGPVHGTGTAFRRGKPCLYPTKFSGRSLETCGQPHAQTNDRHPACLPVRVRTQTGRGQNSAYRPASYGNRDGRGPAADSRPPADRAVGLARWLSAVSCQPSAVRAQSARRC